MVASAAVVVVVAVGIAVGLVLGSGSDGSAPNRPTPTGSADSGTAGGAPGGTPPTGPAVTLSESEERLLGQLKPFTVSDCRSAPPAETGIDAALSCVPGITADPSGPDRLLISHYRDASALAADVTRRSAAITDVGSCGRGETSSEQVVHNAHRVGTFLCTAAPGRFSIFWTIDGEQVSFAADSADAAKLMAWWRGFTPI